MKTYSFCSKDKKLIKVITGIRRSGKSTLLEMFIKDLKLDGISEDQIIYLNFEDFDNYELMDSFILHKYIKERLNDKMTYVFLDEIQLVTEYERVVDSLYIKENTDIYITGSNAHLLSSELATMLSGRYVEIKMMPLSFKEFIIGIDIRDDLQNSYKKYIENSSFPYALELIDNKAVLAGYLEGIYNTVLMKDIVSRNNFKDVMKLQQVIRFIFDNIGSNISIKKISDTLTSNGQKTSSHTIESYLQALIESYIIYHVNRYDVKGKKYLKTQGKYYIADIGLRNYLLGNKYADVGHILENIVYLELLRRDYNVYIGKADTYEIDFVAKNQNEVIYIQVAATVRSAETFRREIRSLEVIKDNHKKILLTLDNDPVRNHNGIIIQNVLEFLTE